MNNKKDYFINLDIKYNSLEVVEVSQIIADSLKKWQNYSLCQVNDCVVRLGVIEGEFHWHKHDDGDEFFYVLDGELHIEYKEEKVILQTGQGFNVPVGIEHKTQAPTRTAILMIGKKTVKPTGD